MSSRIKKAIYRNGEIAKVFDLEEMNEELYEKISKHLYCPNPNCNARIQYVSGAKISPYYRTWKATIVDGDIKSQHIKDCQYSVEYEMAQKELQKKNSVKLALIDDNHIKRVLQRTYENTVTSSNSNRKNKYKGNEKRKSSTRKSKIGKKTIMSQAGLMSDGAKKTKRQPNIYKAHIDDLESSSYDTIKCVFGNVKNIIVDTKYPQIEFITKNNKNARILINEAFKVNYSAIYDNINVFKWYFEKQKNENLDVFCTCVGKITKDDYEISIIWENANGLRFDNKSYYEIVNEMHNL